MRIVAGILFIVLAVVNGIAAVGYTVGGGLVAAAGAAGEAADAEHPAAATAAPSPVGPSSTEVKRSGLGYLGFGVFVGVVGALQLAGAVLLFVRKAPTFVMLVAGLGIAAELGGILLVTFGLTNLLGFVACGLAIVAAWQIRQARGAHGLATA